MQERIYFIFYLFFITSPLNWLPCRINILAHIIKPIINSNQQLNCCDL